MSRNEIRLRRNRMSGQRYRNFGAVMERHEKEMRLKKILRFFTTLLVVLVLIALIFYISQVAEKTSDKKNSTIEKVLPEKT
jgi:cell division septal protein FtsQ